MVLYISTRLYSIEKGELIMERTYIFVCELSKKVQNELVKRLPSEVNPKVLLEEKILNLEMMDICNFNEVQQLRKVGLL